MSYISKDLGRGRGVCDLSYYQKLKIIPACSLNAIEYL